MQTLVSKVSGDSVFQESSPFDTAQTTNGWAVRRECAYPLYAIFLIYSSPHEWKRRAAIRDSLFDERDKAFFNWTGVFLVKQSPEDSVHAFWTRLEADALGDVLLLPNGNQDASPDKLLLGMQWIQRHCSGALYVIKTDDDIMVQPFVLFQYLTNNVEPHGRSLHCTLKVKASGTGSTTSLTRGGALDAVPREADSSAAAGPMLRKSCAGRAIIMTLPNLHSIVLASKALPSSLGLKTSYVTGELAVAAGLRHVDLGNRVAWWDLEAYWFVDGYQIFFRLRGTFDATTLRRALWHHSFWYEALENDRVRELLSLRPKKAPFSAATEELFY
ncbi:hypothetical protein V5799_019792 [Amblyomma americanum]|uniref:Hexosyltransferase n=1 Tax=Amblyomma americanum TaxID=6943 RepID=A0AAQ4EVW6_AMBAM